MIEIGVPLATFIMKKVVDKAWEKISVVIQKRKTKNKSSKTEIDYLYAKIKTRFPYISGTGRPWLGLNLYNKSFLSQPIQTSVKFENELLGIVSLLLPRLENLPKVKGSAGVLEVKIPYSSEVDLEIGDNFLGENNGTIRFLFPTPFNILNDLIQYKNDNFLVPVKFLTPCSSVKTVFIPPPQIVPPSINEVNLPPGKKVETQLAIIK